MRIMVGMSNAAAPVAFLFDVIRRCETGECERGCLCDRLTVNVDVDELTDAEVAHFQAHGTVAQRAEIATYFAPEVPMSKPLSKCPAPVRAPEHNAGDCDWIPGQPSAPTCGCGNEGCLLCLVDSLKGPAPKVKAA